ncbi:MAG: c-type cytochrome [Gammaproteobacteria bacterium]|nr:c-type cytochrome [Gammaproteobacteria bacterium]
MKGDVSKSLVFFLLVAGSFGANGKDRSIPPDDLVYCTVCHGVNLMGNSLLKAPRLSGMASWHVKQQLQSFRHGWRGVHEKDLAGLEMRPMARELTDEQIEQAAKFVASTWSDLPRKTIKGDVSHGKVLYQSCLACHGREGEGNETLHGSPLAGLNDWYVKAQLENYQNERRGHNTEDVYGTQMKAASMVLSSEVDVLDIVSYIATLQPKLTQE